MRQRSSSAAWSSLMPRSSTALSLTGPRPAALAASRPATTSWSRSRRVIVGEGLGPDRVEADVDPVEAGVGERLRGAGEAERVGGQRGLDAERVGAADDVDQAAAQQRLAAGEPDLADAEALDADRDQPDDLVVGQRLVGRAASRGPRPACSSCSAGCTGRSARRAGPWRPGRSGLPEVSSRPPLYRGARSGAQAVAG